MKLETSNNLHFDKYQIREQDDINRLSRHWLRKTKNHQNHRNKNIDGNFTVLNIDKIKEQNQLDHDNFLKNGKCKYGKRILKIQEKQNILLSFVKSLNLENSNLRKLTAQEIENLAPQIKEYFNEFLKELTKLDYFKGKKILNISLHFDETMPHIHFQFSNIDFENENFFKMMDENQLKEIKKFEKEFDEKWLLTYQNFQKKEIDKNLKHDNNINNFKKLNKFKDEIEKEIGELKLDAKEIENHFKDLEKQHNNLEIQKEKLKNKKDNFNQLKLQLDKMKENLEVETYLLRDFERFEFELNNLKTDEKKQQIINNINWAQGFIENLKNKLNEINNFKQPTKAKSFGM